MHQIIILEFINDFNECQFLAEPYIQWLIITHPVFNILTSFTP